MFPLFADEPTEQVPRAVLYTIEWRPNHEERKARGWPPSIWMRHSTYGSYEKRTAALAELLVTGNAQYRAADIPLVDEAHLKGIETALAEMQADCPYLVIDSIDVSPSAPVKVPTWEEYNASMERFRSFIRAWQEGTAHGE